MPSMNFEWLIIDGYNLLYRERSGAMHNLQTARQQLVRRIERGVMQWAPRTTIVFDGCERGHDWALSASHLEVIFSPANQTADGVIERLVAGAKHPEKICVVTCDRVEEHVVSSSGASVLSCEMFLSQCEAAARPRGCRRRPSSADLGATLGDFFPEIEP